MVWGMEFLLFILWGVGLILWMGEEKYVGCDETLEKKAIFNQT